MGGQQFAIGMAACNIQAVKSLVCRTVLLAWLGTVALLKTVAAQPDWSTDAQQALARAKAEQKLVLLNFTGSDWCPWCIRLEREVFSKPEFAAYAKTNLVLVQVDFPRSKQLGKEQQQANKALAEKYGIDGFPTVVVLDSTGKQLGRLGYKPGGPDRFIAELEKLRAKAARRQQPDSAPGTNTPGQKPGEK